MSTYRFTNSQRFSIWNHFDQQCYWCGEPLRLQETTIDHVIPESLLWNPDELARVRHQFGLPIDFEINDYVNWLPTHDACNRGKTNKVFKPVPILVAILERLAREAGVVRLANDRVIENKKIDRLLGKLLVAVEFDVISRDDIIKIFADPELVSNIDLAIIKKEFTLHIDPGRWEIIHRNGEIATVTDGRVGGITPVGIRPDQSWACPSCSSFGPWNGVKCLTCGQMSDPGD